MRLLRRMFALHLISFMSSILLPRGAAAEDLAICRNPTGRAYYHDAGVIPKEGTGWQSDSMKNVMRLTRKEGAKRLDLEWSDVDGKHSARAEGAGLVQLVGARSDSLVVLVIYEGTVELYTFFREKSGKLRFSLAQSRTAGIIPKSALLVGDCSTVRFDAVGG